jgi:hypothetical protein
MPDIQGYDYGTARAARSPVTLFPFPDRTVYSVQELDAIAGSDRSLSQHSAINAGRAVVTARDVTQDFRVRCRRIGIERDHLAARVALKDGDHDLGPNARLTADECVFREAFGSSEIQVHIRPEAPLVENGSDLFAPLPRGLQREERDGPAVRHSPLGAHQR